MYCCDNYGVVYTPKKLASFVADIMLYEITSNQDVSEDNVCVLDPACGEGILLEQLSDKLKKKNIFPTCWGIDVDSKVVELNIETFDTNNYKFIVENTILPSSKVSAQNYWSHKLKNISLVIANPPWSSEKIFSKEDLDNAGYSFDVGQYDSYVLFIELCLKIAKSNAILAFIIPDSLFSGGNKGLRKFLLENTEIRVLARLGEKLFPSVNRATSIIVLRNSKPKKNAKTMCYRLDTDSRKNFLDNSLDLYDDFQKKNHKVLQRRFLENQDYVFDIDARQDEEALLRKIEKNAIDWKQLFRFGRGVEISKSGSIVLCDFCNMAQGYSKKQFQETVKKCQFCGKEIKLSSSNVSTIISDSENDSFKPMYVGENLHRYKFSGIKYIKPYVEGINYKNENLYTPPKILIRKTGLGIYACIDYNSTYTSQTVYSVNYLDENHVVPLEYYLGVLNSRLIYYYYLKKYGENEWKSHPYLTKDIVFSLPLKSVSEQNYDIVSQIVDCVKALQRQYDRKRDIEIENLVMKLYDINADEIKAIENELNSLPDLSAINQMKLKEGELYV